jgi:hypothetical protein
MTLKLLFSSAIVLVVLVLVLAADWKHRRIEKFIDAGREFD